MKVRLHETKNDIYLDAENHEDHFNLGAITARIFLKATADEWEVSQEPSGNGNITLRLPIEQLVRLAARGSR